MGAREYNEVQVKEWSEEKQRSLVATSSKGSLGELRLHSQALCCYHSSQAGETPLMGRCQFPDRSLKDLNPRSICILIQAQNQLETLNMPKLQVSGA